MEEEGWRKGKSAEWKREKKRREGEDGGVKVRGRRVRVRGR